ncbi:DUF1450 domain-containing protein [Ammoniphilus sp. CFH 90114]|uniref:DUF1450 domain-containing protein n=1 Tax=Ammoniphilus sp. CFH 90114 TaxID=2493665 RepID=UPI00100DD067|nr:DUF1450 domain-containing protein [Ammoniphilus sp. CFH 90114]RXT02280.1 DUF1450 domain-containing protein [Ammoniphilus sp. CFH 90114]
MTMTILYCFRNRIGQSEKMMRAQIEDKEMEVSIHPTSCMKLCVFCEKLNVAIVNREVVMDKDEAKFMERILERLE